jgi:Rrf2 family nitric oxide-sensitive transcriptional repressor
MLSQTTEYALRAMACLAYSPDELTPTPRLAELTLVPPNYLAKVLQSLAQASLITGRRGVGGGYKLASPAEEISLLDVVNAIDPVERITSCPLGLPDHGSNLCALHSCVDQAARQFIDKFESVRLSDLIAESNGSVPLCDTQLARELALSVEGKSLASNASSNGSPNGSSNGSAIN